MATGIPEDYEKIQGLSDALKDDEAPVYSPNFYPENKEKILGAISIFETGNAYYYIPPFPFAGESETFNFLFSENLWRKDELLGMVSPIRKLKIISANDRLS